MRIIRPAPYLSDSLSPMARTACHYQREREKMTTDEARIATARSNAAWNAYYAACEVCEDDDVLARLWDAVVIASRAASDAWREVA